jgi:hypothetical protein
VGPWRKSRDTWALLIPIAYDPALRADSRFQEIVRRHGLPASFTDRPQSMQAAQ